MPEKMVRVLEVQVLTLANRDGYPDDRSRPLLRFVLEDSREFFMVNIPIEIAGNIAAHLQNQNSADSRLQIHELIGQLAVVERVEIDLFVPGSSVYQATILLQPEGFERSLTFQLIPSHATLLAVMSDAPLFVAEELIKQSEAMRNQDA